MKKVTLTVGAFLCLISMAKADFTRKMVCRWTFNSTEKAKALSDDISHISFKKTGTGRDQTLEFKDGTAILGMGTLLTVGDINSKNETFARLKDKVTIWIRLKFMSKPQGFFLGFLNADKPADWAQMVFTAHITDKQQFRLFGTNEAAKHFGVGSLWKLPEKAEFINIAIKYDSVEKTFGIYINGKGRKNKSKDAAELGAFQAFAVGRLKKHIGERMIVDEIRIYNMIVPDEWLGEIEPVK